MTEQKVGVDHQDDRNITNPSYFARHFGDGRVHDILARWRREDPVHWTKGGLSHDFWSVTRYEDAKFVLMNDTRIFSVQRFGAALPQNAEMDSSYFIQLLRSGAQLSVMDGDPHTDFRKVFSSKFSPPGVVRITETVRQVVENIFDTVLPQGACDFTVDMAGRLPVAVISEMMAIPQEDWDDLYLWNNMSAAPEDPEWNVGSTLDTSTLGTRNLVEYCARLAHKRRSNPGDDLMSMLAQATIEGKPLTDEQLGFNGLMFFAAGHETTRACLSAGILELLRDPAQMDYLRQNRHDPDVIKRAVEEFVRWTSPLNHTLRTATEDTVIGGQPIKEGDWVVTWFISANRDENAFADAHKFNAARNPNPHLGFATGKHFCLGAHLARLEMQIMMEYLLEHMHDMEIAGPVEYAASTLFCGVKHLPVRFRAGSRTRTSHRLAANA